MSILITYFKAIVMGFAIAAPVGPIGILCIKNVLSSGFMAGMAAGLGAALADAVYGFIAALGITAVMAFLINKILIIKILGGVFLIYLGIKELRSKIPSYSEVPVGQSLMGIIGSTFFLTITNVMTILSFLSIFSSIGDNACCSMIQSTVMVFGIFTGSILWWFILCSTIKHIHRYLPKSALHIITFVSGIILIVFGIYTCVGGLFLS